MAHDVFVSHSAQDKHAADAIVATLEQRGVRCWVAPRDILPGESWATSILNAIERSQVMVLVFSQNVNMSEHVRREVERAVHNRVPIAPIRIENVFPSNDLEYFLSSCHWMDAITPPLEEQIDLVCAKIQQLLDVKLKGTESAPTAEPIARPKPVKLRPPRKGLKRVMQLVACAALIAGAVFGWQQYRAYRSRMPAEFLTALKGGEVNRNAIIDMLDRQPTLINRADADGLTPLHYVAEQNMPDVALNLIDKGAKLDAPDTRGRTALHHAALTNGAAIVVLLLEKGARQDLKDADFKTAYQLAQEYKQNDARLEFERHDLARAIAKHDQPAIDRLVNSDLAKIPNEVGWTALHAAAWQGDDYAVGRLLDAGAPPNARTTGPYRGGQIFQAGCTPLLLACEFSKPSPEYARVVDRLLGKGAQADQADDNGRTALHFAARIGDEAIAAKLLASKVTGNDKTKDDGRTPLHVAAEGGKTAIVRLLLTGQKIDPAAEDLKRQTALHLAAAAGHKEIVELLVALPAFTIDMRHKARSLANENKHTEVVAVIDQWWIDALFAAVGQLNPGANQANAVNDLLKWDRPHPALATRAGNATTLLSVALAGSSPRGELIDLLLKAEPALVDKPDSNGESSLYFAVRTGKPLDLVEKLAEKSTQLKDNDSRGQRLLNVAAGTGNRPLVELLVRKCQLPVNAADSQGQTPLQAAAARLDVEIIQLLLDYKATPDLAALNAADKSRAAARSADADKTVESLGVALLASQVSDPQITEKSLAATLARLGELKLDLVDKPLPNGLLPMQAALQSGSPDAQKVLWQVMQLRKLLDKPNRDGETTLHTAAALGMPSLVQQLLAESVDYRKKDIAGRTAEDAARLAQQKETHEILARVRTTDEKKAQDAALALARAQQEATAKSQQAERERVLRDQQAMAAAASAAQASSTAAQAFYDLLRHDHVTMSIAGVADLDFHMSFLNAGKPIVQGMKDVSVNCVNGTLTIVTEGNPLPGAGDGETQQVTKTIQVKTGKRVVMFYDKKKKPVYGDETVPKEVPVTRHTYSGPMVQKSVGVFEWRVGKNTFPVVRRE